MSITTLTWTAAATRIARVASLQDDADAIAAVKEALSDEIEAWNSKRNWRFLQTLAADIITTANTTTYALPSGFKAPYSANLVALNRPLSYVAQRNFNRTLGGEPNASVGCYFYTCFNTYDPAGVNQIGNVALLPGSVADTLRIRYYRLMSSVIGTTATLDIPLRFQTAILDGARARVIAEKGPTEKISFWQQKAAEGMMDAIADDNNVPDEDITFQAGASNLQSDINSWNNWEY